MVDWDTRMRLMHGACFCSSVDLGFKMMFSLFRIIMDLIRASNVKGISTALRRSPFLIPKIPEVIYLMVKNNLETEAADIAFTFGLEDVCHPRNILTTNLHNTIKDIQNASPLQMNKENAITPESLEEVDILNKPEETAGLKKPEEIDILKQIEQTDICKDTEETAVLKKIIPEEIDTSKTCEVIVALKKLEETVPETSCDQTIAIVSAEKSNGMSLRIPESLEEVDVLKKPAVMDTLMIPEENGTRKKTKEMGPVAVLQFLCQSMNSAELKWHIAEHISEMNNLRVDIANALKLAENPAKLVIYSIYRFFEQSSRTFCKGSDSKMDKQNAGRLASVLILECFVMISSDDGIEITRTIRKYAADAAVVWRNRIIKEGGLRHTDDVDARGLLLLISGFGIQDHVFSIQDIIDLIRASNVKGIATALRRSIFLMPKIREIIYKMVHNDLEIEAVDIAYTFRLEDTYNPGKILTAYLDSKIKDIKNAPPVHMLDAVKQHLLDLKSVKQCLESHNIGPSMLLPNFKINERIQYLEKEVNEGKFIQKRKPLEYPIHHEPKRACVSHQNMPHQHRPPVDHYNMNRFNWSPHPSTSYITAHSASPAYNPYAMPGNTPGHYDQQPYGWHGPYGQHYPRHGQTYNSHPYHRPWEQGPLESFPGFMGRRLQSLDLYGFAELVKRGSRGFPA
ncbi:uncharacterized protein LOC143608652 [Bidens hawaiensis]|uniref:uncharacterized protein LOC143608652 n=1 Tax=Bidens hawaiensis TaxID=980011 RepID=UPI004049CE93